MVSLVTTRDSPSPVRNIPPRSARFTVAGKSSDDLAPGTLNSIFKPRSSENHNMRYAVVIEKADNNYAAYVPDLSGCVATSATVEEVEREIMQAIRFHIDGIREDNLRIPQPSAVCEYVEK